MNIEVMSRAKFIEYTKSNHRLTSAVISISSPNEGIVHISNSQNNGVVLLYRATFDDTDRADNTSLVPLDLMQAEIMAKFVKGAIDKVDKIIVHCGAGQSRSAGIAAAILKYYTNDDTSIFNNPRYTPNMLCYRMMLTALMSS